MKTALSVSSFLCVLCVKSFGPDKCKILNTEDTEKNKGTENEA